MRKIKLKESDLTKIIQRTINESQLLTEIENCSGQADGTECDGGCDDTPPSCFRGTCQDGVCTPNSSSTGGGKRWGGNKHDYHRDAGHKAGVEGGGKYGRGGHYKDYEGAVNERRLTNLVRRAVNEAQLLTEEAPCGFSGRGTSAQNSACNDCMLRGKEYSEAGGDGTDYANRVCFGESDAQMYKPCTDKEIEAGCHEGVSGDCVCADGPKDDRPGLSERAYRRKLRYRR